MADEAKAAAEKAEAEKAAAEKAAAKAKGKIALISKTGLERNRGTYVVPADEPIVLDISSIDPVDLAELEADDKILKVRTDTPVSTSVQRFKRA